MRRALFMVCVLGSAAAAYAQSSSVMEWPPRPRDMAQPPPPTDMGAPPSGDLGAGAASPSGATPSTSPSGTTPSTSPSGTTPSGTAAKPVKPPPPAAPKTLAPAPEGGGIKTIDVPAGKSLDSVQLPKGTITSSTAGLGQLITDVKVVDNTRTDSETVLYIAGVKSGEILTNDLITQVTERLLTVGLFKDVSLTWEDAIPGGNAGVRLIIHAKDKLSWIIAPIFHYSPGDYGGGLAYANSNVFGGNKKFLAIAQYTTAQSFLFLAFLDPNIRNTRWYYRVDALLRRDDIWEYGDGHIANPRIERQTNVDTFGVAALAGVNFTRHLHLDLRLKIYYDNVESARCFNTTTSDGSGTPNVIAEQGGSCLRPSNSGWDNTLTAHAGYDGRSNVYGVLHGLLVDATYQYGASWLGTRQDYHLLSLIGNYAWRFFKEHNLILKLGADIFFDPPFKMEVETGGALMRGLVFRQYRGDTDVRATLEYILPLFTIQGLSVRLNAFYDTNLTWFRSIPDQSSPLARFVVRGSTWRDFLPDTPSGVVRDSWHNGLGGGLRFYLRGVILPLLGVDFAYGIEGNEFQWYLSIGSTLD